MWKYVNDSCRKIHLAKFPTTTEFIADTSPKDSPADLRCALHLLLFGHLYSVLTRCDPLISLHFSPLQRKESTLFLLESSLFWLSETKTNNQYMFISFLIFFFTLFFNSSISPGNALGPADAGPLLPGQQCGSRLHLSRAEAHPFALRWQCSQPPVPMKRVLHTARISNVDSVMFVNRIRKMVSFLFFYLQTWRCRHCWSLTVCRTPVIWTS